MAIRAQLLHALTGRPVNDIERSLLGLPARLGGIGLPDPTCDASAHYVAATAITQPLVRLILQRESVPLEEVFAAQAEATTKYRQLRQGPLKEKAESLRERLAQQIERAMTIAQERGASTWLTALPLTSQGFSLSKAEFRDALCLRYGWTPARLPSICSCGKAFTLDHALSCSHGGYLCMRHNFATR